MSDRDGKAAYPMRNLLLTGSLGSGKTALNRRKPIEVQGWLDAESCAPLDYRHPDDIGGRDRDKENVRRTPGHHQADINRREGIRAFCHALEHPIAADDLCTWLELLRSFAGPDLLRLKAIVSVAGLPGPVLLHGVQHVFHPPAFLTEWPSSDRRTRIVLITRNLNEDCLRELLGILTAAASAQGCLKAAANEPHPRRVVGQP